MIKMMNRRHFLALAVTTPLWVSLVACDDKPMATKLGKGALVVALGDSLTFGYGASRGKDYPSMLAQKTGWEIVNMGVNGDTTQNVLDRLDVIIDLKPKLVLLGIGGNDVLRQVDKAATKNNLSKIIERLQSAKIETVLIAQPHLSASAFFGRASDNPVYKQVAQDKGVLLFSDVWSQILSDKRLKSDQIHANDTGYAQFADSLYEFLQAHGYV